jgi:hypothetical protein
MAQQMTSDIDGFHSMRKFSILTFSGFKRTIHYNTTNNLPILFLTHDFSSPTPLIDPLLDHTTSLLSSTSTDIEPTSNLSAKQRKLLHIHYKMGHLHMSKIQQLARDGLFGGNLTTLGSNCCFQSISLLDPLSLPPASSLSVTLLLDASKASFNFLCNLDSRISAFYLSCEPIS